MMELPLKFIDGHLFVELDSNMWLLDTCAPQSFGSLLELEIAGELFNLSSDYFGLDAASLSELAGVKCLGLIGADVLRRFDILFDAPGGKLTLSSEALEYKGQPIALDDFMGIPIVSLQIAGRDCRMFLDTGAQISYFEDDSLTSYPAAGSITDFYPGFGPFDTDTHQVEMAVGEEVFTVRCGRLPAILSEALKLANTQGILGNQVFTKRIVGFSQSKKRIYL